MSFDDMPDLGPMLFPAGEDYARRILTASKIIQPRCRTILDVPYGADYWQKVDFYLPDDAALTGLPVLCFLHGGSWRHGYKEWMGFMAPPILALPAIFVSVSYRLAPSTKFPAILEDCIDALALVHRAATEYGGDPDRVFYGGHSAGGHLAALVALSRDRLRARGLPDDAIKGCLPVSGIFDLRMQSAVPGGVTELVHPLVFADPEDSESYSPVTCADGNSTPFFVAYGEADLPEVVSTSRAFIACLDHAPCVIEHHMWPGSNHYETSEDLADPDNAWVRKLGAWMMAPPRRGDAHP